MLEADPAAPPLFSVPARYNPRLQALVARINADEELQHWWRCANVNAMERLTLGDHGEVHCRIVANAALRLLRLLRDAGQMPGAVVHHHLAVEDAEVIVVLAAALHDLGLAAHAGPQVECGLPLATLKARELLADLYPISARTILIAEALHAILAHHGASPCLTLEAGVLAMADALDIAEGRSKLRLLTPGGEGGIDAPPAAAVPAVLEVVLKRGERQPVRVEIRTSDPADLRHVEARLRQTLHRTPLKELVEIAAWRPDGHVA
jgi:metal-dependent HD superfamily phosphatase/phosphodiesterase